MDGNRWTGERSAAFALPARHASSTADVYIFTVGLFYRGLQQHKEASHEETDGKNHINISYTTKAVTVTWKLSGCPLVGVSSVKSDRYFWAILTKAFQTISAQLTLFSFWNLFWN